MRARRSVWSNPEIHKLLAEFVPAADEVWSLQHRKDPEALLFQKIAEQGHYAGRTTPSDTRQGIYATAPSGLLLASINTNDPKAMTAKLSKALAKWNAMTDEEKWLAGEAKPFLAPNRPEAHYPSDGLVLRQTVRDLPREGLPADWRASAWNKDYAWFKKEEARLFVPTDVREGSKTSVPRSLLMRLARFNFMDTVRGQSFQYPESAIQALELTSTVVSSSRRAMTLRLEGLAKAEQSGRWPIAGYQDMNSPAEQRRGYDLVLGGEAVWDMVAEKFTKFELVAAGTRFGATQYNGRSDDPGPAPIGYLFQLASGKALDRVPPSEFHSYGWKR